MTTEKIHPPICNRCHRLYDPDNRNKRIGDHIYSDIGKEMCAECRNELFVLAPFGERIIRQEPK